jgi:uncharacterized protein
VVLSPPFQPVCRPDCPGLDPVTGERLADIGERAIPEDIDPRWSMLAEIRGDITPDDGARAEADPAE